MQKEILLSSSLNLSLGRLFLYNLFTHTSQDFLLWLNSPDTAPQQEHACYPTKPFKHQKFLRHKERVIHHYFSEIRTLSLFWKYHQENAFYVRGHVLSFDQHKLWKCLDLFSKLHWRQFYEQDPESCWLCRETEAKSCGSSNFNRAWVWTLSG